MKRCSRRITLFIVWIALLGAFVLPLSARAASPAQIRAQVPGYYRMMLGEFEVVALYDGFNRIGLNVLQGIDEKEARARLARYFLETDSGVQTAVNAYLIHTGSHLVLIDAGTGSCFGPTLGGVADNIRAAGYTPEQIDIVLLTHLHGDHVCGLSRGNERVFPNATVLVAADEADYWLNPRMTGDGFRMAQAALAPYIAAERLKRYATDEPLVPGIRVIPTPGHTPGHASFLIGGNGPQLLIWGDIVHSHAIQFADPTVSMAFDTDPARAVETRQRVFAETAKKSWLVGGAHLPFPGIGHVADGHDGYRWIPVEYAPVAQ